jgi:hypothetical protein
MKMTFRERARALWAHMDGPLGILLVLIAVFMLGVSIRTWQDREEINRIDNRVHSVQTSMEQLCTARVTDVILAYDRRQQVTDRLMREQTERITEQSGRISEQSSRIEDLTHQLALLGKTANEIQRRQKEVLARDTGPAAKAVASEVAKETAKETVKQTNEEARKAINRAVVTPKAK